MPRKTVVIQLRCSPEQKELYQKAATAADLPLSAFVRIAATKWAKQWENWEKEGPGGEEEIINAIGFALGRDEEG